MFLKRVDAVGFKSFAARTTIEARPGVTVIVGPNGCGKSNILDAIRWVLGEASARSLRGKTMQDVIFAGSASFKALGLAEVTLTIDNRRRLLNLDYDEVAITRRLFRTGESEYLINKIACRRRDIQNLFLGTGLGASAYSILEQDQVDQVIDARPTDRRLLFEEAAGISKYRLRKLEALRRLERTDLDLRRLNDLVEEVGRQVASLKRQAGKAERYRALAEQMRQAELRLLALRSAELRGRLGQVGEELRELERRGARLQADRARQAAAEADGQAEAERADDRLNRLNQDHFTLQSRLADVEHGIVRLQDRLNAQGARKAQIATELTEIERRRNGLELRRGQHAERRRKTLEDRRQAETVFEDRRRAYAELEALVDASTGRLDQLRQEMDDHRDALAAAENDVRIAETLIARHAQELREAEAEIAGVRQLIEGHQRRRAELEGRLADLRGEVERQEAALSSCRIRHAEAHGRIADLEKELDGLRRELHQRQARLTALLELKAAYEGFDQGVRRLMLAAAEGRLEGIVGPLVELLKTEPQWETAIEAALGAHLEDVLVENDEAARRGLDFLAEQNLSRVTFWPMERLGPVEDCRPPEALLNEADVLGAAIDRVVAEPRVRPVLERLLARVAVVADFETALRLAAQYPAAHLVSLEGRMIRATGEISGGATAHRGLLGREREIQELTADTERLKREEEDRDERRLQTRREAEALEAEVRAGAVRLQEVRLAQGAAQKDLEVAEHHHDQAAEALRRRTEQRQRLLEDIESGQAFIEERRAAAGRERDLLASKTERAEAERTAARGLNEESLARGAALAAAQVEVAKVRERQAHLEEDAQSLEREGALIAEEIAGRRAEEERLTQEARAVAEEIDSLRAQLGRLFSEKEGLERELTEERTERETLGGRLKALAFQMEQLARDERVLQNDLQERRIQLAELQTHRNHLEEQAREKFGRGLDEIEAEPGPAAEDAAGLSQEVTRLREAIERLGPVSLAALEDYERERERLEFLNAQRRDLVESRHQIERSIATIDQTTRRLFHETFESVRGHFIETFRRLFNGGRADLIIEQEGADPLLDGGIEIVAQPPGKKLQTITLLSGGEKAMTAIALLFALFLHKPAPFAFLDEIDAPLDDANVERFKRIVGEFAREVQFIIVTHNKQTMTLADAIYGVTMEESGVSKIVSVDFERAHEYLESAG